MKILCCFLKAFPGFLKMNLPKPQVMGTFSFNNTSAKLPFGHYSVMMLRKGTSMQPPNNLESFGWSSSLVKTYSHRLGKTWVKNCLRFSKPNCFLICNNPTKLHVPVNQLHIVSVSFARIVSTVAHLTSIISFLIVLVRVKCFFRMCFTATVFLSLQKKGHIVSVRS